MAARTILLVDDSPLVHEFVRLALETAAGWRVVPVTSGAEALAQVAHETFDAALIDVEMPDMDGPATLSALRATAAGSRLPVLFLTGHDEDEQRARLGDLHVNGILGKPFEIPALGSEIARLLGWAG